MTTALCRAAPASWQETSNEIDWLILSVLEPQRVNMVYRVSVGMCRRVKSALAHKTHPAEFAKVAVNVVCDAKVCRHDGELMTFVQKMPRSSIVYKSTVRLSAPIKQVSMGRDHAGLVTVWGQLFMWGSNQYGELALPRICTVVRHPTDITLPGHTQVTQLALGSAFTLCIRGDGEVWTWGVVGPALGRWGDCRPAAVDLKGELAQSVAAGTQHSVVVTTNGRLMSFGRNSSSQLGTCVHGATRVPHSYVPDFVHRSPRCNVVALAAGRAHTLLLTTDGQLFTWGSNVYGQLGVGGGAATCIHHPQRLETAPDCAVTMVAAGASHSMCATADSELFSWGMNNNGQLGHGTTTNTDLPVHVKALTAGCITQIAAGGARSTCVVGHLQYHWGLNKSGHSVLIPISTLY